jgi:hypothetical protein
MHSPVPRTARRGRSQSSYNNVAKGLGYLSIALGVAELVMPRAVSRAAGIRGLETVIRAYGAREIATGVAILASHDPEPWIWGRVAGDMADMATVAIGLQRGNGNAQRDRSALALVTLAAVTVADLACAGALNAEKGNRHNAIRDYSNRTGFPQGLHAARGAARDFRVPDDMKAPEMLRPRLVNAQS